ncbi:MAG TPA: efflux RND transporter periplasmic adaptor subunit [Silvibacterium sp.]|jgi:membrane fusion protein (multidrug efflux system)|nr:efflux RND transporter periplasmic adaptor subunit [Silvibacterium sp.]
MAVGLALGLIALLPVACEKPPEQAAPSPPEVRVTDVVQANVPIYVEWVAQLNGPINADITPKVQGYLLTQNYQNGFFVKKGQLLFTIDPRPFVAALDQAKAQVAVTQANLTEAQNNVARDTPLAAQNAIPQKQLDTDRSTEQANQAQLDAAKAQMVQAELNLGWTNVYSPIDGIAGIANSQVGDLVGTATKMTTISQVNPIWAYFNIPESAYLANAESINRAIRGGVRRGVPTNVEFIQANGITYPEKGQMILVNREIGSQTGTIQIAAAFPNKDASLRPGGFGRVRIQTGVSQNALLIPQPAVIEVQSQYQVIVLTPENKAAIRPVKVGDRVGPNWIITEGLKPGEKVVVEGIQRVQMFAAAAPPEMVKEGIPVVVKPYMPAPVADGGN